MTGYLKLEMTLDNKGGIESEIEAHDLSNGEILALAFQAHYDAIEGVAKSLGLNAEETDNKIGQMIMQSRDALLQLYLLNMQKEEKEHGNVIRLDRHI